MEKCKMEDLELQLLTLLKDNWHLERENTLFHRNMRKVEGSLTQPNIIIREKTDVNKWDKEGTGECLALIVISTRLQASNTTNEAVETAKETKHNLREEIYRILGIANDPQDTSIAKPTGWEWSYVTRRINKDNFDASPALLGEELNLSIAYQR